MSYNVPYLVGDVLNRDHQYWPTITPLEFASHPSYIPPRTNFLSRKQIMAAAWRVKRWRLLGHVNITMEVYFPGHPSGEVTFDFDVPQPPAIITWTYVDATARETATGFSPSDIGKFALQSDDTTYWELKAVTPKWEPVGLDLPVTWNKRALFTADFSTSTFTSPAHGLIVGSLISISNSGGALPSGLTAGNHTVAAPVTANTFKLSGVTITDNGTGDHIWSSGDIWPCAQEPDLLSKANTSEFYKFTGLRNRGFYNHFGELVFGAGPNFISAALSGSSVADYIALGGGGGGIANPYLTALGRGSMWPTITGPNFNAGEIDLFGPSFGGPSNGNEYVAFNGSFYPYLRFEGGFQVPYASFDGGDLGYLGFSIRSLPVAGSGTLTVDPVIAPTFDIPMVCGGTLSAINLGDPDTSSTGNCEFDLRAVEFWPYQNSLGQPVYDTLTGEQINDPFA